MKCRECSCCRKGWFTSRPNDYACIGVLEPFVIRDINVECTEYEERKSKKVGIKEAIAHFKYGISHDIFSEPVISYAKMAVEALEKQVGKRPIEIGDGRYECPACHANERALDEYCDKCEQKINWDFRWWLYD